MLNQDPNLQDVGEGRLPKQPCSLVPPGCSAAIPVPPHEWEMHPLCHLLLALFLKKLGCFNVCYPNTESVALSSMQINGTLTKNHSK